MKTYFFTYKVIPSQNNPHALRVAGAYAHFWVVDVSVENAIHRAQNYLSEYMWIIESWEQQPVETNAEHFAQKDLGLICYLKAQEQGLVAQFLGWGKDGEMDKGTFELIEL